MDLEYDSLFKGIFYQSMKDCDNEQDSYNWAEIVFANKCKVKQIIPPTLKCIKEDKLLLKTTRRTNTMIMLPNLIKLNLFQMLIIPYQILKDIIWGIILNIKVK